MRAGRVCAALLLAFVIGACTTSVVYTSYEGVAKEGWASGDELFFSFPVSDTTVTYSIYGSIRYTSDFGFLRLPLGVVTETPSGDFTTEEVDLSLEGKGKESVGRGFNIYQKSFLLDPSFRALRSGVYTVSFRHLSTDSIVRGVMEVGLMVRRNP